MARKIQLTLHFRLLKEEKKGKVPAEQSRFLFHSSLQTIMFFEQEEEVKEKSSNLQGKGSLKRN